MAISKRVRPNIDRVNDNIGLLANGSSGQWEVAIDETTSGPERWFMQIESASICLYFEIASPNTVGSMVEFLDGGAAKRPSTHSSLRKGTLIVGTDKHAPVRLIRDD